MSNIPSIRFQNYHQNWESKTLSNVVNFISTGKLDANAAVQNGKYKFFTCSREDYLTDSYEFDGPAVLINGNGDIGLTKVFSGKFNAYQRTYVLMDFNEDFNFVGIAIPNYLPERIRKEAIGGAMPYIKLETLEELVIKVPTNDEQKQIAKFLFEIDFLINQKQSELDKSEKYKQSMLYKMFPKSGSSTPEIRFADFSGEWHCEKFGDLYDIFNGLNKEKSAFGSGTPIINYMDVNKNFVINDNDILSKVELSQSEINSNIVNNGDILLARTSEIIEEIAFSSAYIGNMKNVVFSGFLLKASPLKKDIVDSKFIALNVRYCESARNQIGRLATKTSRALINGDNLKRLTIMVPEKKEQEIISNFFISLDKLIVDQENEIVTLKRLKDTLLKKMFA